MTLIEELTALEEKALTKEQIETLRLQLRDNVWGKQTWLDCEAVCDMALAFPALKREREELIGTLLDCTNALAESVSHTHPYAKIVDQARALLSRVTKG